jgi:glycine/D-amino acid oxidase-like deaminating enzyme/nitrite reductase/ring-hydroxylating ferredoxin subunit
MSASPADADADAGALPGRPVSTWLDGAPAPERAPLAADLEVEVLVIGAGIVGMGAALELQRDGAEVAVIEARTIGAGVSGNTTAKLSSLHGLTYDSMTSTHGAETARLYGEANQWGIERVAELAAELEIECDLRRKPNFTYTEDPDQVGQIEAEVEAAREAGLPAQLTTETDLPFEVAGAIRFDDQAEFHPVAYLRGIAAELERGGATIHERTRATAASGGRVRTEGGATIEAEQVIVATHVPFLDRGLFFARAHVERSYAVTARVRGAVAQGMYLQSESPGRTLRAIPWNGGELLMVGGESHELGHGDSVEAFGALERYARQRFEVTGFEHRWDAHDFMPEDGLPYIGRLWPRSDRLLTATGMRKWGLAMGTAAGRMLADRVGGRDNAWAARFDPWRLPPAKAVKELVRHNADSGLHFFADRLHRGGSAAELRPGEGRVLGSGLGQKAVHRDDDGVLHAVSARCTHLGCIVKWNGGARTWDCPCHGSRFGPDGAVLNGPATQPLEPRTATDD